MPGTVRERRLQLLWRDFAGFAGKTGELQSAAKKFRRASLVGNDVGLLVTQHDSPWRRHLRRRQCVCRRAGRHQECRDLALKNLRQTPLDLKRPVIIAIAPRIARVGGKDGVENGGRNAGRVVAGEVHW